jgi:hypothetical protein
MPGVVFLDIRATAQAADRQIGQLDALRQHAAERIEEFLRDLSAAEYERERDEFPKRLLELLAAGHRGASRSECAVYQAAIDRLRERVR